MDNNLIVLSDGTEAEIGFATESNLATDSNIVMVGNLWDRPILATPLNQYTVTEGLLLLIFLVLAAKLIFKIFNN